MKPIVKYLLFAIMLIATPLFAAAAEQSEDQAESSLNPKETIFEHLGDAYGWEVPFNHHVRMPLPVIVKGTDGLHVFSSARVANGATYTDGDATFVVAGKDSPNKGKVVELVDGKEVKPSFDISITKNVAALFIAIALVVGLMLWLARFHKNHPYKSPRKGLGFMELMVVFIYDSVIKSTLQDKAKKFRTLPPLVICSGGMSNSRDRSSMTRGEQKPPWQRPMPARTLRLTPSRDRAPRGR